MHDQARNTEHKRKARDRELEEKAPQAELASKRYARRKHERERVHKKRAVPRSARVHRPEVLGRSGH